MKPSAVDQLLRMLGHGPMTWQQICARFACRGTAATAVSKAKQANLIEQLPDKSYRRKPLPSSWERPRDGFTEAMKERRISMDTKEGRSVSGGSNLGPVSRWW